MLLEHGADTSIKVRHPFSTNLARPYAGLQDQDDLTAEELASEAGYDNIVSILRKDKLARTTS